MSKNLEIRQKLYGLGQGEFQTVCNHYLERTYGGELHSPGTVEDKNKTRPGKPDTYLVMDDGTYILAESTTHDDLDRYGYAKKLKSDLDGCLQFPKLGITNDQLRLIVLCVNGDVDIPLHEELNAIIAPFHVKLRIVTMLTLVEYFYNVDKLFARDVLGVAFETGQVLSKAEFLLQYEKKHIATPLGTTLFGRQSEIEYLYNAVTSYDITIISGPAGVGKSRLAMHMMDQYVEEHPEFQTYYILSKPESITEDLLSFLTPGKSYIVMIDDANRQLENVVSVLERAVASRINVKVILTVRDYAKQDVLRKIRESSYLVVPISILHS